MTMRPGSPPLGSRSCGAIRSACCAAAGRPAGRAAALLVSCAGSGKEGLIPTGDAGPLQGDFEAVAQAAENGDGNCAATESALQKTEQDFAALPPTHRRGPAQQAATGHRKPAHARPGAVRAAAPQSTSDDERARDTTTSTTTRRRPTVTQTTTTQTTPTTPPAALGPRRRNARPRRRRHARARAGESGGGAGSGRSRRSARRQQTGRRPGSRK